MRASGNRSRIAFTPAIAARHRTRRSWSRLAGSF
jgi:hypothetical protein